MVTKDLFGPYDRYTIFSGDLEVSVITLGATVTALKYKGAERAVCYQTSAAMPTASAALPSRWRAGVMNCLPTSI